MVKVNTNDYINMSNILRVKFLEKKMNSDSRLNTNGSREFFPEQDTWYISVFPVNSEVIVYKFNIKNQADSLFKKLTREL